MTRYLRFIVHNWPLKLAAIGLASLLYGGLVLSQTTQEFSGNVSIQVANAASDVIVLSNPGSVTRVRYVAPPDLGLRIDSTTFRATVDLAGAIPSGDRLTFDVAVEAVDPRIQVLDFEPRAIVLQIDRVATRQVPIRAVLGPIPSGLDIGEPTIDAQTATVTGPESVVNLVTEAQARVVVDGSGIDVNQVVTLLPVDASGEELSPVDVAPAEVRVKVPVFTDRRSKSLPVTPVVVGTPAAGFEIESISVDPAIVSVEADANDLAGLERADTVPISVSGASSTVTQSIELALPDGVQALGGDRVTVTITLRPVTGTRTFEAGLQLVGARPDLTYQLSTDRILVTIGGSLADLDRLSGVSIVLTVDVTGLDVGTSSVAVSANLATGLTLIGASPNPINVIVSSPIAPSASPAAPSPTP
jgi:YbbR domain-containing protein